MSAAAPRLPGLVPGLQVPPPVDCSFFASSVEEAPGIPESDDEAQNDEAVAPQRASPLPAPAVDWPLSVPRHLEVSGSLGVNGYPAMSPRSGLLKRKAADHLQLNGIYTLRPTPHGASPCWEKPADDDLEGSEARVLFRAADGLSWVIDAEVHSGGQDELVLARLWTAAENPTAPSIEVAWAPTRTLRLRAVCNSQLS
mmetsp:Transcript_40783/g.89154  ORF Transcript_40783/g.89154 Transcript_40783/m.89154 type:complete len:198 (-) Transcript_40783:65-658(-)